MKMSWFTYALIGMLFFAAMILIFKKLTSLGLKASTLLLFVFLFGAVLYGVHTLIAKTPIKIDSGMVALLALAALCSYIGNLFYVKSIETAPNPAYSTAVISLQIVFIAVGAIFFFGSEMTLTKGIGILVAIIAMILLSL